ncbi:MAG: hypothetical protein WCX97_02870 [Candidatus Magasanikbacteria bacterium]
MLRKSFILAIIIAGAFFAGNVSAQSTSAGTNYVAVTSCEQVTDGIKISRNKGAKYILNDGCRDSGYGLRNYTMTCISNTKYKVSWTTKCVSVDDEDPTISLISSKSIYYKDETVKLTAKAKDNVKVARIEITEYDQITGARKIVKTCLNASTCLYSVGPFYNITNGKSLTYRAFAYDKAQNSAYSDLIVNITGVRVVVDNIGPNINLIGWVEKNGSYNIEVNAQDDYNAIKKIEVVLDEALTPVFSWQDDNSQDLKVIKRYFGNLSASVKHRFIVRAWDKKNNIGYSMPLYLYYENEEPSGSYITMRADSTGSESVLSIDLFAADSDGIKTMDIYLGVNNETGRIPLFKKCDLNSTAATVYLCSVSMPLRLFPTGNYFGVITDKTGYITTTSVRHYINGLSVD